MKQGHLWTIKNAHIGRYTQGRKEVAGCNKQAEEALRGRGWAES